MNKITLNLLILALNVEKAKQKKVLPYLKRGMEELQALVAQLEEENNAGVQQGAQ